MRVGVTPRHHICVVAEMHWGAEMTARVGGTPCRHIHVIAGRCRGRNDGEGGWYTSPSLSCGHGKAWGMEKTVRVGVAPHCHVHVVVML